MFYEIIWIPILQFFLTILQLTLNRVPINHKIFNKSLLPDGDPKLYFYQVLKYSTDANHKHRMDEG